MTKLHNYQNLSKHFNNFTRIISDWDDTITSKDTISLMFNVLPKDADYNLDYFYKVYQESYNNFMDSILPTKPYKERDTLEKEIAFQKDMKDVEKSSMLEVIRLKTFKGYSKKEFQDQVVNVKIKSGFEEFFTLISTRKSVDFSVLSVNWTRLIIKEYFERNFHSQISNITIRTNEFEFDPNGICTGDVDSSLDIRSGYDKLLETKTITKQSDQTLYVGDSTTDILSMIYCNKAIIMKGGSASKTLRHLGYVVYDIDQCITESICQNIKFLELNDWHELVYILNPNLYKL